MSISTLTITHGSNVGVQPTTEERSVMVLFATKNKKTKIIMIVPMQAGNMTEDWCAYDHLSRVDLVFLSLARYQFQVVLAVIRGPIIVLLIRSQLS